MAANDNERRKFAHSTANFYLFSFRFQFSCGLFRLLTTAMSKPALADSASAALLRRVCGALQEHLGDRPTTASPLLPLIVNFQRRSIKEEPMEQGRNLSEDR